jgi:arsenite/tail-anchored protein-transporting ATPase
MDFVVATIPTMLALQESARLVRALRAEGLPVRTMVVNQIVREGMSGKYLEMKLKEQAGALNLLRRSEHLAPLDVVRGRMLDLEVRGLPALQYVAGAVWAGIPAPAGGAGDGLVRSSALLHPPARNLHAHVLQCAPARSSTPPAQYLSHCSASAAGDRRFYLLGGKGGVGKTTMSAALAVHMATQGVPTLVVSTDPAHSLSDSLAVDVSGGMPVRVAGTSGDAALWGLEIDPAKARQELRDLAKGDGGDKAIDMLSSVGLGALADQLKVRGCTRLWALLAALYMHVYSVRASTRTHAPRMHPCASWLRVACMRTTA